MKATSVVLRWWGACLLATTIVQSVGQSTEPANPSWATVTIPYAELRALWEAAEAQTRELSRIQAAKPPIDAVLLSSDYELRWQSDGPDLEAVYEVRTLTEGWHVVPLLGGDVRLNEVELEQAGVVWQDGRYSLLAHGARDHQFKLRFWVPPLAEWNARLNLIPARSALNRLRISGAPDGMIIRVAGCDPRPGADGSTLYRLPAELTELVLALEPDTASRVPVPSPWELHSEALVSFDDGRLIYRVRVRAQADSGSGTSMELVLPANALETHVSGEDLVSFRLGTAEAGRRTLHLAWETPDLLHRTFLISYQVPQPPLSTHWLLQAPGLTGEQPNRTHFVIVPVDGLGLVGTELREARNSARLPEWIRQELQSNDYYTAESGAELELQATWLPRVQTAQAMIHRAEFHSRMVEDGGLLVAAEFTLQHEAPLNWRVHLPAVDQLLACQVNGVPVQPVRRDTQDFELALGVPEKQTTRVVFSYAARLPALDPVSGSMELELPRTDLFIHELHWILSLPDRFEITALEGNVRIAGAARSGVAPTHDTRREVRLVKELVQGEAPRAEIHYQRRGLTDSP